MFDNPLDRLEFADLKAFLRQEVPEGPTLDYKERLTADLPETACSFANTAGGYIILGVGEGDGEDLPDSDNVPGLDASKKPWPFVYNRITSRTRPTVVPKVSKPLELDDGSGRVVLVVYVGESLDAPHEVMGSSPRIMVRRGNKNEPVGLNDVEASSHIKSTGSTSRTTHSFLTVFGYTPRARVSSSWTTFWPVPILVNLSPANHRSST